MPAVTHAGNVASHDAITLLAANLSNRAHAGAQRHPRPATSRLLRARTTAQEVSFGRQLGKPSTSMPNSARRRRRVFV